MARIVPLFSSSKGNSYLLSEGDSNILIDCGVSTKRLKEALLSQEIDPSSLSGILLTHEHSDHIKGLKIFSKNFDVPIYGAEEMLSYIADRDEVAATAELSAVKPFGDQVGDFWVESFVTPHDSVASIGFRITLPSDKTFGFATDIGAVTDSIKKGLMGCEAVVLESNYDLDMLKNGGYPYHLKRRIASPMGHLDNKDAAELAVSLVKLGTTRFILGHLSQENNLPTLAKMTFLDKLGSSGISEEDYRLIVASPVGNGQGFIF